VSSQHMFSMETVFVAGEEGEVIEKVRGRVLALVQRLGAEVEVEASRSHVRASAGSGCSVEFRIARRLVFGRYEVEVDCAEGGDSEQVIRAVVDEIVRAVAEREAGKYAQEVRRLMQHAANLIGRELTRMGFAPSGASEWRRADGTEASLSASEDMAALGFAVKRGADICLVAVDAVAGVTAPPMCGTIIVAEGLEVPTGEPEGLEALEEVVEPAYRALLKAVAMHHKAKYCYN